MDKAELTRVIIDVTNDAKRGVRAHKLREEIRENFVWDVLAALRVGASDEDAALIDALLSAEAEYRNTTL